MTSTTWTQTAGMDSGTDSDTVLSYAEAAEASATAAASSATSAAGSATSAATSAATAGTNATTAAGYAATALTHANTAETYATSPNVTTVATNISNINAVGGSIVSVNGVYGALTSIAGVYADLTDIGAVASNATNINTVSGLSAEISSLASISSDISAINTYLTQIDVVYDNISSVRTLANNLDDIAPVLAVADDLAVVGPISGDVTTVAGLEADILAVPGNVTAAQAAQAGAEAAYDAFDDRYLGAKATAPTTDNDGNALLTGALYWNTGINALYIWDGSAWNAAAFTASGAVTSFNGRTGAVTLSSADVVNALGFPFGVTGNSLSTTTQTAIASFAIADFDAGKLVITANDGADSYVVEMLIAHDGTTAVATEYGQVGTGAALASYDVDISGGNLRVLATPASATSTAFKVIRTLG